MGVMNLILGMMCKSENGPKYISKSKQCNAQSHARVHLGGATGREEVACGGEKQRVTGPVVKIELSKKAAGWRSAALIRIFIYYQRNIDLTYE